MRCAAGERALLQQTQIAGRRASYAGNFWKARRSSGGGGCQADSLIENRVLSKDGQGG